MRVLSPNPNKCDYTRDIYVIKTDAIGVVEFIYHLPCATGKAIHCNALCTNFSFEDTEFKPYAPRWAICKVKHPWIENMIEQEIALGVWFAPPFERHI